jgi:hypothetical protein
MNYLLLIKPPQGHYEISHLTQLLDGTFRPCSVTIGLFGTHIIKSPFDINIPESEVKSELERLNPHSFVIGSEQKYNFQLKV